MDNLLRKVESDEVVVYTDQVYSIDVLNKCREIHQKLVDEGKIESDFDSDKWMGYSGHTSEDPRPFNGREESHVS